MQGSVGNVLLWMHKSPRHGRGDWSVDLSRIVDGRRAFKNRMWKLAFYRVVQGGYSLCEAGKGGVSTAGSDLTYACFLMGNTGVDSWQYSCIDHFTAVNAGGGAGKVECRQTESRVGGQTYASTVPPTNWIVAGAEAIAKPPTPAVSVMALSPRSRPASSGPKPGK